MAKKKNYIWKDRKHVLWFPFTFTKYCIIGDKLYKDVGLLNTSSDQLLLYRVVDLKLTRTIGQRLCGTGTIILDARVDRDGGVKLENIKRPKIVKEMISNLVENARDEKRVVGKEFFADTCHHDHGHNEDDVNEFFGE